MLSFTNTCTGSVRILDENADSFIDRQSNAAAYALYMGDVRHARAKERAASKSWWWGFVWGVALTLFVLSAGYL